MIMVEVRGMRNFGVRKWLTLRSSLTWEANEIRRGLMFGRRVWKGGKRSLSHDWEYFGWGHCSTQYRSIEWEKWRVSRSFLMIKWEFYRWNGRRWWKGRPG